MLVVDRAIGRNDKEETIMLGFIYSVVSYLAFLGSFSCFALFTDGLVAVPRGSDGRPTAAVLVDVGLMLLFGLQHSIMARAAFKRVLTRVVPAALERSTYVLASSAVLTLLMWQWRPLATPVWTVGKPWLTAGLWVINALGWVGVPLVTFLIDHFELVGLKQAFARFRRVSFQSRGFVSPLLYRYLRHPMMSSLLVGLWVTPRMTIGHALLSAGMSLYIVIGVHFEERSLAEELGEVYVRYQAAVPRFVPNLPGRSNDDRINERRAG
jgi:protein-S-isoprenylcysteine O-methyltransferase Ste14